MKSITRWLIDWYLNRYVGHRCQTYCFGCPSCEIWRGRDLLLEHGSDETWFAQSESISDFLWEDASRRGPGPKP